MEKNPEILHDKLRVLIADEDEEIALAAGDLYTSELGGAGAIMS